jgi:hypothetical protein
MKSGCTQYTFCWNFYDLQYTDYFFFGWVFSCLKNYWNDFDKTGGPCTNFTMSCPSICAVASVPKLLGRTDYNPFLETFTISIIFSHTEQQ